tara:strand:- start:592 stop:2466 length:1875 start_codon:yes stop_codon:yes gene_type:complete
MNRIQKCGNCKEIGHNRRCCPLLNSNNKPTTNILLNNEEVDDGFDINNIYYINTREDEQECEIQKEKIQNRRRELENNLKKDQIKLIENKLKLEGIILKEELKRKTDYAIKLWKDKGGNKIWYNTQEECGELIYHELINLKKSIALAVAEPGVGKTNLIQYLIYKFKSSSGPSNETLIVGDRITIATGMSSKDWISQTTDGTLLLDKNNGEEVYHRDTFHKRIKCLKSKPELLSDHVFILDECHIGCDKGQTLDKLFNQSLGLTKESIERLNIKIILISATPDIVQAELLKKYKEDWGFVRLEKGNNYRGFEFIKQKEWLNDYTSLNITDNKINIKNLIKKYDNPKYHIIRIKGKRSEKLKKNIMELCGQENIGIYSDHNQTEKIPDFKEFLKNPPDNHTFIFIKDFYRASYRLRLNNNMGLIIEPSFNKDVTVVAQNLLARFFGYYEEEEVSFDENPTFICNVSCVNTYIDFTNDFTYEGLPYESRKLKKGGIPKRNKSSHINNHLENNPDIPNMNTSRKWTDNYGHDPSNVNNDLWLDHEEYNADILDNKIKEKFNIINNAGRPIEFVFSSGGYWTTKTHSNKKYTFNDNPPNQGGSSGSENHVIVYKNTNSSKFIIRTFNF